MERSLLNEMFTTYLNFRSLIGPQQQQQQQRKKDEQQQ